MKVKARAFLALGLEPELETNAVLGSHGASLGPIRALRSPLAAPGSACSPEDVAVRVFAQAPPDDLDPAAIVRGAGRYFEATVNVLSQSQAPSRLMLSLESARRGDSGRFSVTSRAATDQDREDARKAEARGKAAGMSLLAARCPSVWEVVATEPSSAASLWNLCAVLASVALGPVLPEDGSTLFGVRGAMERVEAISGRSLAR